MANAFTKVLDVMFEQYVENYEPACVLSTQAEFATPNPQEMQRAGDTFYVPQDYMGTITTGLDISASSPTDALQRMVPVSFNQPDNVWFRLDTLQLRDEATIPTLGKKASLRLAASVESTLLTQVGLQASIFQKNTPAFSWTMAIAAEAALLQRGIPTSMEDIKLFMNPTDYQAVAIDLGNRAYLGQVNNDAYQRNKIPPIGMFSTFRPDTVYNLAAAGTISGTTVSGTQSFTPSAMTTNLPTDNRRMTLTVAGVNIANTKNGDAFTIVGVNAVHMIDKSDSGSLQTFRIISGAGTASLVITPAIVATGPYQNVTAAAAGGAALVFLNTATKPVNVFWKQGAVRVDYAKPAFGALDGAGVKVMTGTTKNGVPLNMIYVADGLRGTLAVRFTTMSATTVLLPEQCGIIMANQP